MTSTSELQAMSRHQDKNIRAKAASMLCYDIKNGLDKEEQKKECRDIKR